MSGQSIHLLLSSLADVGKPEPEKIADILGTALTPTQENPSWLFYKFELSDGIFAGGEFRVGKSGDRALLVLTPVEEPVLFEKDLDLAAWGEPRAIDVNPRIPPEGTDAYIYDIGGVKLSLQWTHSSRRLRTVALEWSAGD